MMTMTIYLEDIRARLRINWLINSCSHRCKSKHRVVGTNICARPFGFLTKYIVRQVIKKMRCWQWSRKLNFPTKTTKRESWIRLSWMCEVFVKPKKNLAMSALECFLSKVNVFMQSSWVFNFCVKCGNKYMKKKCIKIISKQNKYRMNVVSFFYTKLVQLFVGCRDGEFWRTSSPAIPLWRDNGARWKWGVCFIVAKLRL